MSTPTPAMRIEDPAPHALHPETEIYRALLPLAQARVLELGCGRAELTRAIAEEYPGARITALEVDATQHALNRRIADLPSVRFDLGGAEAIPAEAGSFDVVLMFKSLHHVPTERLDDALAEIGRVLVPGGLAYVSEPVFAGEHNEILRIFHDEQRVRAAAFAALERAVASGAFELVAERFFDLPVRYAGFAEFEERVLGATHTEHRLSAAQAAAVRERFMRSLGAEGALFRQPMRVDLLRKPAR